MPESRSRLTLNAGMKLYTSTYSMFVQFLRILKSQTRKSRCSNQLISVCRARSTWTYNEINNKRKILVAWVKFSTFPLSSIDLRRTICINSLRAYKSSSLTAERSWKEISRLLDEKVLKISTDLKYLIEIFLVLLGVCQLIQCRIRRFPKGSRFDFYINWVQWKRTFIAFVVMSSKNQI